MTPQTPPEQVRARYEALVRAFPPDRAPRRFAAISDAWRVLSDPDARLEHELFGMDAEGQWLTGSLPPVLPEALQPPLSRAELGALLRGDPPPARERL